MKEFKWKSLTEIPTEHYDKNPAISPTYLVKCSGMDENGCWIVGYSNYSFVRHKWIDCFRATSQGIYKVIAWTDIKM